MRQTADNLFASGFEIDDPTTPAHCMVSSPDEITYYLMHLLQHKALVTLHPDGGESFFLSAIAEISNNNDRIFLEPAADEALNIATAKAQDLILVANLNRIRIQTRLQQPQIVTMQDGRKLIAAPRPANMLRLQRREFFRLEPSVTHPIYCTIGLSSRSGKEEALSLKATDISGSGIGLLAPIQRVDDFLEGALFENCRLEIPEEPVLRINLRIRKAVAYAPREGKQYLRVGCEFVALPAGRLATIERYITRLERERQAKERGLDR